MKPIRLTRQEREIEQAPLRGEYLDAKPSRFFRAVREAVKQIKRGEVVPWTEVKRRHRLK